MNATTIGQGNEQYRASRRLSGSLSAVLVVGVLVAAAGPAGAIPPGWSTYGPNGGMDSGDQVPPDDADHRVRGNESQRHLQERGCRRHLGRR